MSAGKRKNSPKGAGVPRAPSKILPLFTSQLNEMKCVNIKMLLWLHRVELWLVGWWWSVWSRMSTGFSSLTVAVTQTPFFLADCCRKERTRVSFRSCISSWLLGAGWIWEDRCQRGLPTHYWLTLSFFVSFLSLSAVPLLKQIERALAVSHPDYISFSILLMCRRRCLIYQETTCDKTPRIISRIFYADASLNFQTHPGLLMNMLPYWGNKLYCTKKKKRQMSSCACSKVFGLRYGDCEGQSWWLISLSRGPFSEATAPGCLHIYYVSVC